jgi:hypothetical protein
MPDFARAEIATSTEDLSAYRTFLRKLEVGQVVSLPLQPGESTRRVMRSVNLAAGELGMRVTRLSSETGTVRFRVTSPQKRTVNISEETRRQRVEKAKATRAARRRQTAEAAGS